MTPTQIVQTPFSLSLPKFLPANASSTPEISDDPSKDLIRLGVSSLDPIFVDTMFAASNSIYLRFLFLSCEIFNGNSEGLLFF